MSNVGFEVEVEYAGEVHEFTSRTNGGSHERTTVFTIEVTDSGVVVTGGNSKMSQKEKWGIKTAQFHQVRAITHSPNHWNARTGNLHYFFFLEGCKSDEKTRGFYNEFLSDALAKDRKVFEVLGSKVVVEPTDDELSGLGFSDTIRKDMVVEVEGSFKSLLTIKF